MVNKERSTKIINFMTPRVWIVVLGCAHIVDKLKVLYLRDSNAAHIFNC